MKSYQTAKIYLHYISNFFLHFVHDLFFLLMRFSTPHHGKIHSIKLSRNSHHKVFLLIYCRNILVRTLVYEVVCACGFEFLRNFLRIFVTFMNKSVREIFLIISSSTDHEFSEGRSGHTVLCRHRFFIGLTSRYRPITF